MPLASSPLAPPRSRRRSRIRVWTAVIAIAFTVAYVAFAYWGMHQPGVEPRAASSTPAWDSHVQRISVSNDCTWLQRTERSEERAAGISSTSDGQLRHRRYADAAHERRSAIC